MSRHRLTTYAVLIRWLTMSALWLILLIWFLNAYRVGCGWSAVIYLVVGAILLMAGAEQAYFRRRVMLNTCMRQEGRLFRLFHSRRVIFVREALLSAALTLILMVSALLFEPRQWSLLFADLMLLTLLLPRLAKSMSLEVRGDYRFAMARNWAMWISVLLIWTESMLALIYAPPSDYMGMRWQEVVTYGVSQPYVGCELMQTASEVYATGQALAVWAVQNVSRSMHNPTQSIMIGVGLACLVTFPFFVAYAFSRALVGVMARPWEMAHAINDDSGFAHTPSSRSLEPDQT